MSELKFSQPLFMIPFSSAQSLQVEPYRRFASNFELGFSGSSAEIFVQQRKKEELWISAPDHAFEVDVTVKNPGDSKWLSLEGILDAKDLFAAAQISVLLSLRSTVTEQFSLVLRILRQDGSFEDVTVGAVTPEADAKYTRVTMTHSLEPLTSILAEKDVQARLILFAPSGKKFNFSLSMFNVFITNMREG